MSQTLASNESKSGYYGYSEVSPRKSFSVVLAKGEDGWIVAKCSELNVVSQGRTYEEAEKNVVEAVELVLEDTATKEFSISITRSLQ